MQVEGGRERRRGERQERWKGRRTLGNEKEKQKKGRG